MELLRDRCDAVGAAMVDGARKALFRPHIVNEPQFGLGNISQSLDKKVELAALQKESEDHEQHGDVGRLSFVLARIS